MAKKKESESKTNRAFEAWMAFMELCKTLFGDDNAPYNVNELDKSSKFYNYAVELAKELEIDWDGMSHEESNRLMLALLDDYYQNIREVQNSSVIFKITVEEKKPEKTDNGGE